MKSILQGLFLFIGIPFLIIGLLWQLAKHSFSVAKYMYDDLWE